MDYNINLSLSYADLLMGKYLRVMKMFNLRDLNSGVYVKGKGV